MRQTISSFRRNFLAGLLITVPFGLTVFILFKLGIWIISLVSAAPARFLLGPLSELPPYLFRVVTFAIGLIGTILVVFIAGMVARNFIGRKLLSIGEEFISKIPFARTIYKATKHIIETIFGEELEGIKRVVMFEFPRKGIYSIGFVTGVIQDAESGKRLLGVFLPTAFNPTGGYYMLIPEDEVRELSISVEDAFRIIISGGLGTNQIGFINLGKEDHKEV
ncbi:MAG TPA: DUF502 domain-containing protein [Thermodesulfobacteriota bacterium]|nr:DUF502 domain-containing protein [Thermodesulfobacteriota bacterium]